MRPELRPPPLRPFDRLSPRRVAFGDRTGRLRTSAKLGAHLLGSLMLVLVVLFGVELEEDAAGVLGVEVRLRPTMAALDAPERLHPVVADRLRRRVDVLDFEGDVMEARPPLREEAVPGA